MRESMFSILGPIEGLSFLDLFSGSGLVGIEAASRGCEPVHLVEMDRKKRRVIKENMQIVETQIDLYMMSVQKFTHIAPRTYDLIYADPPFPMAGKEKLSRSVLEAGLLAPGGLYIIHYPSEEQLPDDIGDYHCVDHRKYGRSMLRFYRTTRQGEHEDEHF
jgi:16S rRNA (guanine(966)-N(2))-methyltransferase RsmD